nr:collagen alpha-3(VI) chain isoform X2 [Crassostrea gigas]
MDVLVSMLCFKIAIFLCSGVSGFLIDSSNSPLKNPVATQSSHRNCSLIEADVVFLLDASGSVGSANFFQQINLVKTFVENSNIGPSNVQVSVVTFSTIVQEVFNLSRYQSKEALLSSMNTIKYSTGSTHTSEAILYAVQHSFTHAAGDRPLVPNFLFVVTDGRSTFPSNTTGAANLAHQAGIITFAIGIGSSVSRQELQDIATSPQHVFQVPDFNVLSKLHSELTTKICEVPKAISTTTITSTAIASSVNALSSSVLCSNKLPRCEVYGRTVCSSYVTWAKVNCPLYCGFCTDCSLIEADVVFLLDASGSVGSANFFQQINLVKTFVENSNIGPSNVQVSVVTFSTRVQEVFNLSRYQSKEALLSSMNTIKYSAGSTHTSEAILYAVQHSFTHAAGDRPLVPNFLFVVTDGRSTFPSNTTGAANLAHQAGIITFAIGIGSSVSRQELQDIATSPQHVFQVPDFNVLSKLHSELTTKICEVPKTISTTTITSTAIASSVNALSSSVLCSNKLPRCEVYGRTVCSSYVTWAKVNCPLYCGFCTDCSLIEADVVFLLDASGSVGSANFFQQINLVKTFVENSNIGPSNVQVSVVTFSTRVQEVFNLSRYQSKEALLSSMNTIKYSAGSTHTSEAILYAVQHSFTHAAGDRPLVPNFLFVVTDGRSTFPSNTTGAANLAHQAGIITFAIGIGSSVSRQELQDIATSPQHVFQVPDFNVLSKLHSELTTKICEALSSSVLCSNKLPRCEVYGRTVCSSYVTWAKVNCPLYCGFCTVSTMYVTIPTKVTTTSMDTTKTSPTTTLPSSTTKTELTCPACDENLNCVWNRACFHGEVCMIRQYHNTPFTVHCSKKQDCIFMKTFVKGAEIMCCEDHQCISNIVS